MKRSSTNGFQIFLALLVITLAVWFLRGFGILTFIPGGLLWILILVTISSGVIYGIQRSKRW